MKKALLILSLMTFGCGENFTAGPDAGGAGGEDSSDDSGSKPGAGGDVGASGGSDTGGSASGGASGGSPGTGGENTVELPAGCGQYANNDCDAHATNLGLEPPYTEYHCQTASMCIADYYGHGVYEVTPACSAAFPNSKCTASTSENGYDFICCK